MFNLLTDPNFLSYNPITTTGVTVVELKKDFAAKLEAEGYCFLQVGKSVADEEQVELVRLHCGGWIRVLSRTSMQKVSPVEFKYYFPAGTPIRGEGAPVLRTRAGNSAGPEGARVEPVVLAIEVRQGQPDPQPPGFVGYPIPHFATSIEAIANYYGKLKLR